MSGDHSFKAVIFDLDGVVYVDGDACPGAVEGIQSVRDAGLHVLFMTNNASRTPAQVADHLGAVGVKATAEEILNSSQVGATHLASLREEGADELPDPLVLAVGGPGVAAALAEEGFSVVSSADIGPDGPSRSVWAVLQGYGPDLRVRDLHEVAFAINSGARWIATNADATIPTTRGIAPGNGSLLAAVTHGTGKEPEVVGKPYPRSYRIAVQRLGVKPEEVLAVGDRLDTDIEGANEAQIPSALVLTGVNSRQDAEHAKPRRQPKYIESTIPDLSYLWD